MVTTKQKFIGRYTKGKETGSKRTIPENHQTTKEAGRRGTKRSHRTGKKKNKTTTASPDLQ